MTRAEYDGADLRANLVKKNARLLSLVNAFDCLTKWIINFKNCVKLGIVLIIW